MSNVNDEVDSDDLMDVENAINEDHEDVLDRETSSADY